VNTVYAQLMLDVGPDKVVPVAEGLGITAPLTPDPSLVLGTGEVSVQDMATSYLTFAREGERVDPYIIAKVENSEGGVIYEVERPGARQVIKQESARAVTHALRAVIDEGSGTGAKLDRPVAGKTGTTQQNGDAWFAGYTPNYAAVVWMGYPEGAEHRMDDVHGRAVTGGSFPADIWKQFMDRALTDVPAADFAEPPSELLDPPKPAASLVLTPAAGPAGSTVEVAGSGFRQCIANWYVAVEPGMVASAPQPPSVADLRAATVTLPADLPEGTLKVTAFCDRGAGPEALADAAFEVDEPEPPPTTAPPTTESPTTAPPTTDSPTTEPPTTETPTTDSTTTTKPDG
jgi:membrane peptidoglycan carboxypeptidase